MEQLGDAFLAQQADVMDSVPRLRHRAVAQGTLRSTLQAGRSKRSERHHHRARQPRRGLRALLRAGDLWTLAVAELPAVLLFGPPPDIVIGDGFIGFGIGIEFGIFEPWWGWYGCN